MYIAVQSANVLAKFAAETTSRSHQFARTNVTHQNNLRVRTVLDLPDLADDVGNTVEGSAYSTSQGIRLHFVALLYQTVVCLPDTFVQGDLFVYIDSESLELIDVNRQRSDDVLDFLLQRET